MFVVGIFPQLVVSIMSAIKDTEEIANILDWVFIALLPNYNMGQGFGNLFMNYDDLEFAYTNCLRKHTG